MLRSILILGLLISTGLAAPASAQFGAGCDSICSKIFSNLSLNQGLPVAGLTAAVDGNTNGVGGGAFVQVPVGKATAEGGIVAVIGDQSFGDEDVFRRGRLEAPRYLAVQAYVHGSYSFPMAGGGIVAYPLVGPRVYYWDPEDCSDGTVFCEEAETSVGVDLGGGIAYGPAALDVFTGIGGVPSVSVRLKVAAFGF